MSKERANVSLWVVIVLVTGLLSVLGVKAFMVQNFNVFIGVLTILSLILVIAAVVIMRRADTALRK